MSKILDRFNAEIIRLDRLHGDGPEVPYSIALSESNIEAMKALAYEPVKPMDSAAKSIFTKQHFFGVELIKIENAPDDLFVGFSLDDDHYNLSDKYQKIGYNLLGVTEKGDIVTPSDQISGGSVYIFANPKAAAKYKKQTS
jgi:hypothetical protein